MNANKKQNEIPCWDMTTIYTSVDSDAYMQALVLLEQNFDEAENHIQKSSDKKSFAHWLYKSIQLLNDTQARFQSLFAFVNTLYTTDTGNESYVNALSYVQEKGLRLESIEEAFRIKITAHKAGLEDFYTEFPQSADYRYIFEKYILFQEHQMSNAEEGIARDLQRYGADAWSRLHDQIISHSVDRKTGKTFNELRNEAYHEDRNVRKYAYEKELEILQTYDIPLAAALNNIKGATIRLNQKRRWEGAIEKSLYYNRISNKTLNALIGAMEDSLPFWRSYFDVKAKLLGVEKCAFYDMFAPLMPKNSAKVSEKIWDFAEAKKYITERFYAFSKDMGDFAEQAFSGGWIDAKIRKGKVGGAYCEYFPAQKESRILSNFSGTFSDITTLAHELGHAYHNHCVKNADIPFTHYPMTLAETASIFCETIVIKKAISETTGFERIKLLEMHLSDANQVTVDILSRFYFERAVFEERSSQELGVQDFCRLMAKAQEKTYGSGLSEERHSYMWAVKSHYYSPELDFYNFPYAFGLLFSLSLYARYKNEGTSFVPMYENLLRETGRADCETICRNLGFDIESKDFWASGLDVFKEELCELQAYANENA